MELLTQRAFVRVSRAVAAMAMTMALTLEGCATGGNVSDSTGDDGSPPASGGDATVDQTGGSDAPVSPPADGSLGDTTPPQDSAGGDESPLPEGASGEDGGADVTTSQDGAGGADADAAPGDAGADGTADTGADVSSDGPSEAVADAPADVPADVPVEAPSCVSPCGAGSVCVSGACTPAQRVFVTSGVYDANLGGIGGADAKCQALVTAASLGGSWKAWISDASNSPSSRFTHATVGYRLLDGTLVASNWTALVGAATTSLAHAIDLDETAQPFNGGTSEVWTATNPDGTLNISACNNFNSGDAGAAIGAVGHADAVDFTWTNAYLQYCNRSVHLYCFEQ
jgi:hypothetical protein